MSEYVCENCGRIGWLREFNDDCTPGWTHGRLIEITGRVSDGQVEVPLVEPNQQDTSE